MDKVLVGMKVGKALNKLSEFFVPEAELTFIMRVPGVPDTQMIISNDNLKELSEILAKQKTSGR
ncbi:hypothetical protein KAR91_54890 [Candidatus Pacearchaeota archaeon]|nr:hypothetical protein [Candidatus Pacearchaeota archaeon]